MKLIPALVLVVALGFGVACQQAEEPMGDLPAVQAGEVDEVDLEIVEEDDPEAEKD